jgi:predicted nicotinamide N-methyase
MDLDRAAPIGPRSAFARRQRLLSRIHRSYVTTTQTVRLGGISLEFTRIADPDRVLDQVADEADRRERRSGKREPDEHLHLPYWAELWDSAYGIGQFLVREGSGFGVQGSGRQVLIASDPDTPTAARRKTTCVPVSGPGAQGTSVSNLNPEPSSRLSLRAEGRTLNPPAVLDLGCGMGLSGTIAAALGARVLFADIEPPALLFAQLNSLPWASRVRARKLNWRTDRLDERFDLIVGADILYERAQWEYQEPFLRYHLAHGGQVLLGEPGRQTGDLFLDWIKPCGWELEIFAEKVPTRDKPVRILRLTRS